MKLKHSSLAIVSMLAVSLVTLSPFLTTFKAQAITASDWKPGRIIDDSVFFNKDTMSVQQIQSFLDRQVGTCDTGHAGFNLLLNRGSNHWGRYDPPFVCINNFYENPGLTYTYTYSYLDTAGATVTKSIVSTTNNAYKLVGYNVEYNNGDYRQGVAKTTAVYQGLDGTIPAGAKSAAQIIWEVSQAYGINPQALIVMLQKETGLITDTWAAGWQYDRAMGYGCPDSGPNGSANCNTNYSGFYRQIDAASWQIKQYVNNPDGYNFKAGVTRNILWSTNDSCGSSPVYIETQATAALYNYTPYQPNATALSNLRGSQSDGCSQYGNRNFWVYFNDWFGSSLSNRDVTRVNWSAENLVGGASGVSPSNKTLGLESKSIVVGTELFVFYYNATDRTLELSKATASGWVKEVLDGGGGVGGRISADVGKYISVSQTDTDLYVFYYDQTNGDLRLGTYNIASKTWQFEVIDGNDFNSQTGKYSANVGEYISSSTYDDVYGKLQIFFYDRTYGNLRHGWFTPGTGWRFENLEGDFGSISRYDSNIGTDISMTIYNGTLQLFYYDAQRGNLRHGWFTPGTGWRFENLEGDFGSISRYDSNIGTDISMTIYNGTLQLFYYDAQRGNLRHGWFTPGTGWRFENLEGDFGSISRYDSNIGTNTATVVYKGTLLAFYRDERAGVLRTAAAEPAGWRFATLEGNPTSATGITSNTGFSPTVTSYGDSLQLFFFDNDQRALRHLWGYNRY